MTEAAPLAPVPQSLDVLKCPTCSSPVPLGDESDVRCWHCGATVPIPEAHRALAQAQREREEARRAAEGALVLALRPPGPVVRTAALLLNGVVFLFVGWFPALLVGLRMLVHGPGILVRHGLYPNSDAVPGWVLGLLLFAPGLVMLIVGRVLGILSSTRIEAYARLAAGLQARPPQRPGGPALCRLCSAPLLVPPDRLVVGCAYCGADNAVKVEADAIKAELSSNRSLAADLREAVKEAFAERRERRRSLYSGVFWFNAKVAFVLGTFFASMALDPGPPKESWEISHGPPLASNLLVVVCALSLIGFIIHGLATMDSPVKDAKADAKSDSKKRRKRED